MAAPAFNPQAWVYALSLAASQYPELRVRETASEWAERILEFRALSDTIQQTKTGILQAESANSGKAPAALYIQLQEEEERTEEVSREIRSLRTSIARLLSEVQNRIRAMALALSTGEEVCFCQTCREEIDEDEDFT
ncbi:uncharacterized protein N7482_010480 [Penicillium canariense]|uniref:Uncharacterized protein n=1 Tax=Penicillium canariense TaxID=189055 RepID=A0A9W9HM26_9EURO|nr:uncharacterized protein N7482_010480 [Penicillium canariense]KAJ5151228.1 hypothetical protein N7482_010480 [Penicillium canariense]